MLVTLHPKHFNDYYLAIEIDIEHHVAYTHIENGLIKSFIKCLKFISRPLIINSKFPFTIWGHNIMHIAALIQIRPFLYYMNSPLQLERWHRPEITNL